LRRSPGEGIRYPLQYSWASLAAHLVKNPPIMQETWVQSLGVLGAGEVCVPLEVGGLLGKEEMCCLEGLGTFLI